MISLAAGIDYLDLNFLGFPNIIATAVMQGPDGVALIDPGPATSLETLRSALTRGGISIADVRQILLTHIHLDHAGATGTLVKGNPSIEVFVHERGAPHLADPAKLLSSAARLYGQDMDRLWGEFLAVPSDRLRVLAGGETVAAGGRSLQVAYTPGHASHHVTYFRDGVAYVGDVAGVRIGGGPTLPPTPPPDIDIEAWHASIDLVERAGPRALAVTHFGTHTDVAAHLATLRENLDAWAQRARAEDPDAFEAHVRADLHGVAEERAYLEAMPPETLYAGLARYWRNRNNVGG